MEESIPLYQSVSINIKEEIHEGYYKRGQLLPTEEELSKKYLVSRVTIRKALELLVESRYILKRQGSGSKVIYDKRNPITDKSIRVMSFQEEMSELNKVPSKKVLCFEIIPATLEIAKKLDIEKNTLVYHYERLMCGNDFPYSLEIGYIPSKNYPDFSIEELNVSKFNYFENKKKVTIEYSEQKIQAILANKRLSELLRVGRGIPLVRLDLTTYLKENQVLECNTIIFDSNNYQANFIKYR